jgi:hypothetical protein
MLNRRLFLAAPFFVREMLSKPPSGTLRLASFGGSGMAYSTLDGIASHPKVKLVCVAEVDSNRLEILKLKYPDAKIYQDWRVMLHKERGQIDAACVGTPDHMHASQAISSMRMGLPVYVQKPLAHDIHEVRTLMKMARAKNLPTQMGIQIHSAKQYKTAVSVIQSGAIGKVKEVHTWSEKKWGDTADDGRSGAGWIRLEFVARGSGHEAVYQGRLSSRELAQADGFRDGDVWRYGMPHSGSGVQRAAIRIAGVGQKRRGGAEWRELGARYADPLCVSGDTVHLGKDRAGDVV